MSIISNIVNKHIREYDIQKTGKWIKPEPPPENTFNLGEIYLIGNAIISEIEGSLSDKILKTNPTA